MRVRDGMKDQQSVNLMGARCEILRGSVAGHIQYYDCSQAPIIGNFDFGAMQVRSMLWPVGKMQKLVFAKQHHPFGVSNLNRA
jgi:hypothetical protein